MEEGKAHFDPARVEAEGEADDELRRYLAHGARDESLKCRRARRRGGEGVKVEVGVAERTRKLGELRGGLRGVGGARRGGRREGEAEIDRRELIARRWRRCMVGSRASS